MFAARGIDVVVGAEHHASLLGPLGAPFLSLDIWVAEEDGEEAAALLHDLRNGDGSSHADDEDFDEETCGGALEGEDEAAGESESADDTPENAVARSELRRRTALVLLLGCCVTFGTGHMAAGAWTRGLVLAAVELAGILQLMAGHPGGGIAVLGAILADVIGALWRLHAAPHDPLPPARVRRS